MDFNFILLFIESIPLQFDIFGGENQQAMGSADPIIKGVILSLFAVSGFGILLNIFNSVVRKKMIDQTKLKRIMKETAHFPEYKHDLDQLLVLQYTLIGRNLQGLHLEKLEIMPQCKQTMAAIQDKISRLMEQK